MNRFADMSTKSKLILGFGIMWLLLALVIFAGYASIGNITRSEKELYEKQFTFALELRELRSHQNFNRSQMLEMMMITNRSAQEEIRKSIEERLVYIDDIIKNVSSLNPGQRFQSRLAELKKLLAEYRKTRDEEISLVYAGKIDEARKLGTGVQNERFDSIRNISMELGDEARKDAESRLAADMELGNRINGTLVTIGAIAFILGVLLILLLNRVIAKPLSELTVSAERIAEGDLIVELRAGSRKDEVGVLTQAFARMIDVLRGMADAAEKISSGDLRVVVQPQSKKDVLGNSLARMIASLRRMVSELSETVNALGSSASEILASTTQVASGTAETSTAINETTTTVEEVRQAARLSSDKANAVSENALRVAQVVRTGQKAVEDTAAGIGEIREQMEAISRTIVDLSDRSRAISGIIATVSDLADQSNLLAVNAGIEAARAGDQGKSFAIVAQEIRSLAEQSKQATAQIREILTDIQRSTGTAVMASERGGKAVEAGVKQSSQAGESIRVLADVSAEAAQAATQIAASSQQQVVGMDQIGTAMESVNLAGAQTAASMKQVETAARDLHEMGLRLKGMIEPYRT